MADSPAPFSDLLDFLRSTQLFDGLERQQLATLVQLIRGQTYNRGASIFLQGDPADGFFIVRSGRVKVFQLSANGREQILHIFGGGDHFAEVPALDGETFPASATALESTELLFFPRQFFLAFLEQNPKITINLLKSFARHLRRFSLLVDNLSLREVPGRLATYLLNLSDEAGGSDRLHLNITKSQLAALLGTIPETLSRTLYKLSQDRILEIEGKVIYVRDRAALEKLAQ
ncbi:MAG: Crp/Fnr family transcriptional regulator [Leptolyngbyaceae cyanobacterium]